MTEAARQAESLLLTWNCTGTDAYDVTHMVVSIDRHVKKHVFGGIEDYNWRIEPEDDDHAGQVLLIVLSDRFPLATAGERKHLASLECFVDGSVGGTLVRDANYEVIDRCLYLALSLRKPTVADLSPNDPTDASILFEKYRTRGEGLCKKQISRLGDIPACDRGLLADLFRFLAGSTEYQVHITLIPNGDSYILCAQGPVRIGLETWNILKKKYMTMITNADVSRCYVDEDDKKPAFNATRDATIKSVCLSLTLHLKSMVPKPFRERPRPSLATASSTNAPRAPGGVSSKSARMVPYVNNGVPAAIRRNGDGHFYPAVPGTDDIYITMPPQQQQRQ